MNSNRTTVEPEYELKHRLTGAAILMLFAVVVIPLLLSEPALEANNSQENQNAAVQTFRSRIVPLNLENVNGGNGQVSVGLSGEQSGEAVEVDTRKPALLDLTVDSTASTGGNEDKAEDKVTAPKQQKTALVMTQDKGSSSSGSEKAASDKTAETKAEKKPESKKKVAAASNTTDSSTTQASAAETSTNSGWIVRVGTFSKQANVDSVSQLLNKSGFNPKTKPVETSLGMSTRVWLGPYAKRETADKISDRLKSLIGEKGYVTRTSS